MQQLSSTRLEEELDFATHGTARPTATKDGFATKDRKDRKERKRKSVPLRSVRSIAAKILLEFHDFPVSHCAVQP